MKTWARHSCQHTCPTEGDSVTNYSKFLHNLLLFRRYADAYITEKWLKRNTPKYSWFSVVLRACQLSSLYFPASPHFLWSKYGEGWQNVVYWRRGWRPLQCSCLENPTNSMRRQNDRVLKEELPSSVGAQYATGGQWRNNSRKNEGMEPRQKQYPVVDGTGDRSKVWCCKEQNCLGTWNVRSMNQGKLEVVKQEMARLNVDILGIRELKWTGMGEFNSDDYYLLLWARVP